MPGARLLTLNWWVCVIVGWEIKANVCVSPGTVAQVLINEYPLKVEGQSLPSRLTTSEKSRLSRHD
jgi:hypothetical protein